MFICWTDISANNAICNSSRLGFFQKKKKNIYELINKKKKKKKDEMLIAPDKALSDIFLFLH